MLFLFHQPFLQVKTESLALKSFVFYSFPPVVLKSSASASDEYSAAYFVFNKNSPVKPDP